MQTLTAEFIEKTKICQYENRVRTYYRAPPKILIGQNNIYLIATQEIDEINLVIKIEIRVDAARAILSYQ